MCSKRSVRRDLLPAGNHTGMAREDIRTGIESLGVLLTIGLFYTVVCVLVVLPALLDATHGLPPSGATERTPTPADGRAEGPALTAPAPRA